MAESKRAIYASHLRGHHPSAFQGTASLFALKDFRKAVTQQGVLASARESKDPTIFAVVFEDLAGLGGLVVAFGGVLLGHWLGSPVPDGLASILIGLLLAAVAILLARETRSLLAGEPADPEMVRTTRALTGADLAVRTVWPPITLHFGPRFVLVNLDIQFLPALRAHEVAAAVERLERAIRARYPIVRQIFSEARALTDAEMPGGGPPPSLPQGDSFEQRDAAV